ncbi:hypothetical protein J3F83DRAFT_731455 [Trichoderma novae-zelandiae]
METRKPEYQHFIPQFLLRNFSHKYVPPGKSNAGKPKKRGNKKKMYAGEPVINSLGLSDGYRIEECLVRRACGLENMYVDTAKPAQDQGKLEKKFGVLENRASNAYRKITKAYEDGKPAVWLQRSEKDILRKFIFLLTYRGEQYHRKYNFNSMEDYDEDDKGLLQAYMTMRGFTRPIDVWLQSLETIIDLDMDAGGNWKKSIFKSIYFPIADSFVSHIGEMYMAICTPANADEEFVLTDNCYNVSEGQTTSYYDESVGKHILMSPRFHKFAPISPRLILVLRHNLLPEPTEDANPEIKEYREFQRQLWIDSLYGSGTKSILEDLPVQKATTNYSRDRHFAMGDNFCFTIFKIPTGHVRKMNGLLIDHAFHGSRIVFNRKDAFLDLMEWYLTEPCEVGKNLMGEHAATQLAYIEGLSQFMLREGRALEPEWTFWPSEHRDLKQFHTENISGARFLEEISRGENDASFGFVSIYERLGGTKEKFVEDEVMAKAMFEIWARCVDLDWGTPGYEQLRSKKLDWLLDGYQRQSCAPFWMFLKRMRFAQTTLSRWLDGIHDVSSFDEEVFRGSEDMLAYSHPVIHGRELNVAMCKAFNKSMDLVRGPGCGIDSMGYFSLFGDPSWRIPTPVAIKCWPWNDGSNVDEALLSSLVDDLDRKASAQSPRRNELSEENKTEELDMSGLRKAAHAWLFEDDDAETRTEAFGERRPDGDSRVQEILDATEQVHPEQVHPEQPQNETTQGPPPNNLNWLHQREAHTYLIRNARRRTFLKLVQHIIHASWWLYLLGWCCYLLAHLLDFVVATLTRLSWVMATCSPVFDDLAKYLVHLAAVFVLACWMILG